jgi:hypothetical protein
MPRKERIWEGFAQALATRIADKFFDEQIEAIKAARKDAEVLVVNKYFLPLKKKLDALPEHVVGTGTRLLIVSDGKDADRYYSVEVTLPEVSRVPNRLAVPKDVYDALSAHYKQEHVAREKYHKLYNDLFNNLVVAESFEEVVTKWPESKALAEEVSLTHATTMNVPLEKILGRYVGDALPAPTTKRLK